MQSSIFDTRTSTGAYEFEKPEPVTLRPYQQQAIDAGLKHDNGVITMPTGSGKSLIIAGIVSGLDGRAVILQPSREILESNLDKIRKFGFKEAAVFSASMGVKEVGKATYATIGSVINRPELFQDLAALIIDECHLVNPKGGQYLEFAAKTSPRKIIGLTATPYRLHTTSMGSNLRLIHRTRPNLFKKMLHVTQTRELVEAGYLHTPEFVISGQDGQGILKLNSTGAEYTDQSVKQYLAGQGIIARVAQATQHAIAQQLKHILIFMPTLAESAAVVERLRELAIRCDSVSGDTPAKEREAKLQQFRSGSIRVMVNVGVLTTGYDFPALDCIISARPTMSLALYFQIIGRCVRPHPQKQRAVVYDLVDNYGKFGNPLTSLFVETSPGIVDVMCEHGRLTSRMLDGGVECRDKLDFGPFRGCELRHVSDAYLHEYTTTQKRSPEWHLLRAEQWRRRLFAGATQ